MKKILTILAVSMGLSIPALTMAVGYNNPGTAPTPQKQIAPAGPAAGNAMEQRSAKMQKYMDKWKGMSPEQKQQVQTRMQQRWQTASPEQKAMAQERILMQFNSMSAQEKQQLLNLLKGNM